MLSCVALHLVCNVAVVRRVSASTWQMNCHATKARSYERCSPVRIPDRRPTNVGIVVCAVRNAQCGRRAAHATEAEMLSCVALHLVCNVALVSRVSTWQSACSEKRTGLPRSRNPRLSPDTARSVSFRSYHLRLTIHCPVPHSALPVYVSSPPPTVIKV